MSSPDDTTATGQTASGLLRIPHVGTYCRQMKVSLERMYENAVDWEHLPYLHSGSFCDIELIDGGDWGWHARAGLGSPELRVETELELSLDRDLKRWITTTLSGPGEGTQIWTHVFELGERHIQVNVDFFVPGVSKDDAPAVGEIYKDLYATLYDEDERMMVERQQELDRIEARRPENASEPQRIELGDEASLLANAPTVFELAGNAYRLVRSGDEWLAHGNVCGHWLAPLDDAELDGETVVCPWHGYRFSARTGDCTSGQRCRLRPGPAITVENGVVTATLKA